LSIIQTQGIHHITLNGANREISINFWQNVLGMKLILEQPNLDDLSVNHLYFDCGDGRTLTVFSNEDRKIEKDTHKNKPGSVHHIAFWVSQSSIKIAERKLKENGYPNNGIKDRGFMDSLYFRDPLGLLIEIASYKFDPPYGFSHGQVLEKAHSIRLRRGAINIEDQDISEAINKLVWRS